MTRSRGFTLIEISVAVSILAVVTTMGIAAFVSYSRNQALQTSAYELSTTLNLAKSRAFSQVKPEQCLNQSLDGYRVLISALTGTYELDVICSGNIYKIKDGAFSKNVTVVQAQTTSTSFFFPVISGGVVGSGSVVLSGFGQTRTIIVDSFGTVK